MDDTDIPHDNDFFILTEFNEQEGPIPLLVYPEENPPNTMNLFSFAIRIMTVETDTKTKLIGDYLPTNSTSVLIDDAEKLYAFVYRFTLSDIYARGYVRPYALCYVTNSATKILSLFDELRVECSTVCSLILSFSPLKIAHYLQSKNWISFRSDLIKQIRDIHFTYLSLTKRLSPSFSNHIHSLYLEECKMKTYRLPHIGCDIDMESIINLYEDEQDLIKFGAVQKMTFLVPHPSHSPENGTSHDENNVDDEMLSPLDPAHLLEDTSESIQVQDDTGVLLNGILQKWKENNWIGSQDLEEHTVFDVLNDLVNLDVRLRTLFLTRRATLQQRQISTEFSGEILDAVLQLGVSGSDEDETKPFNEDEFFDEDLLDQHDDELILSAVQQTLTLHGEACGWDESVNIISDAKEDDEDFPFHILTDPTAKTFTTNRKPLSYSNDDVGVLLALFTNSTLHLPPPADNPKFSFPEPLLISLHSLISPVLAPPSTLLPPSRYKNIQLDKKLRNLDQIVENRDVLLLFFSQLRILHQAFSVPLFLLKLEKEGLLELGGSDLPFTVDPLLNSFAKRSPLLSEYQGSSDTLISTPPNASVRLRTINSPSTLSAGSFTPLHHQHLSHAVYHAHPTFQTPHPHRGILSIGRVSFMNFFTPSASAMKHAKSLFKVVSQATRSEQARITKAVNKVLVQELAAQVSMQNENEDIPPVPLLRKKSETASTRPINSQHEERFEAPSDHMSDSPFRAGMSSQLSLAAATTPSHTPKMLSYDSMSPMKRLELLRVLLLLPPNLRAMMIVHIRRLHRLRDDEAGFEMLLEQLHHVTKDPQDLLMLDGEDSTTQQQLMLRVTHPDRQNIYLSLLQNREFMSFYHNQLVLSDLPSQPLQSPRSSTSPAQGSPLKRLPPIPPPSTSLHFTDLASSSSSHPFSAPFRVDQNLLGGLFHRPFVSVSHISSFTDHSNLHPTVRLFMSLTNQKHVLALHTTLNEIHQQSHATLRPVRRRKRDTAGGHVISRHKAVDSSTLPSPFSKSGHSTPVPVIPDMKVFSAQKIMKPSELILTSTPDKPELSEDILDMSQFDTYDQETLSSSHVSGPQLSDDAATTLSGVTRRSQEVGASPLRSHIDPEQISVDLHVKTARDMPLVLNDGGHKPASRAFSLQTGMGDLDDKAGFMFESVEEKTLLSSAVSPPSLANSTMSVKTQRNQPGMTEQRDVKIPDRVRDSLVGQCAIITGTVLEPFQQNELAKRFKRQVPSTTPQTINRDKMDALHKPKAVLIASAEETVAPDQLSASASSRHTPKASFTPPKDLLATPSPMELSQPPTPIPPKPVIEEVDDVEKAGNNRNGEDEEVGVVLTEAELQTDKLDRFSDYLGKFVTPLPTDADQPHHAFPIVSPSSLQMSLSVFPSLSPFTSTQRQYSHAQLHTPLSFLTSPSFNAFAFTALFDEYPFIARCARSLLVGVPVIIFAPEDQREVVQRIVGVLSFFVIGSGNFGRVELWRTVPYTPSELGGLALSALSTTVQTLPKFMQGRVTFWNFRREHVVTVMFEGGKDIERMLVVPDFEEQQKENEEGNEAGKAAAKKKSEMRATISSCTPLLFISRIIDSLSDLSEKAYLLYVGMRENSHTTKDLRKPAINARMFRRGASHSKTLKRLVVPRRPSNVGTNDNDSTNSFELDIIRQQLELEREKMIEGMQPIPSNPSRSGFSITPPSILSRLSSSRPSQALNSLKSPFSGASSVQIFLSQLEKRAQRLVKLDSLETMPVVMHCAISTSLFSDNSPTNCSPAGVPTLPILCFHARIIIPTVISFDSFLFLALFYFLFIFFFGRDTLF
ncbi:hypothetical protein BLNAU_17085 [Blattamonas nauphoetae]|uniref:UDENN FLCN/SMCR8-type domain-containing protein n=1 Tax=Blattamonas nauphoetae TaxID=2049346 RepID=A0ABQ9X7Q2_9EUKA|nr:hypothetical protein BLNAU_17085 [Blattamonas nauphoetae]